MSWLLCHFIMTYFVSLTFFDLKFILYKYRHWFSLGDYHLHKISFFIPSLCLFVFLFVCFLRLHPWHMEVLRLGVKLELQLPAYTTATAMWDPSLVCDLHHSSQQCQILNPLSDARDRIHNLMVPRQICFCCSMMGTSIHSLSTTCVLKLKWVSCRQHIAVFFFSFYPFSQSVFWLGNLIH